MDDGGGNGTSSLRVEVRADAAKLTNVVIAGFGNRGKTSVSSDAIQISF